MGTEVLIRQRISRTKPQPYTANTRDGDPSRASIYGDGYVLPLGVKKHWLADEGSFFTATLAPGATALQLGLSASFSAAACCLAFQNTDTSGKPDSQRCYLDQIRFNVVTPPTSGTSLR